MFEQLVFVCLLLLAVTLARLLRRGGQWGYALVVAGSFVAGVVGFGQDSRFWGAIAVCMTALTVVAPWMLDGLSRWAHGRGRLAWAVRLMGIKSLLMPGAGLSRQQQILRGVILLEQQGVDAAIAYLRDLAEASEHEGELALIHEQMVSMLFYGLRWDEGIAQYERRFHPGYAAVRPMLALGLLRAYGESGRLERAAGLLRALEEGPVGADPRSAELLGQARFTFLAYAGQSAVVDQVVAQDRCADLGLTRAVGALFHGISLARAGDSGRAAVALRRVEAVAGPRDARIIEASRQTLGQLPAGDLEIAPEVRTYARNVAERLVRFLQGATTLRHRGRATVTYALIVVAAAVYGVTVLRGEGGLGLLQMGALSPALSATQGWRAFTSIWLHASLSSLLFDAYAIWLAGHVVERLYGGARLILIVVGSAIAGQVATLALDGSPVVLAGGGHLLACGALVAGLWSLLPSRMPELAASARRSLLLTFGLLMTANLFSVVPGTWGFDTSPIGYGATVVVASLLASGPRLGVDPRSGRLATACAAAAVVVAGATLVAAAVVARDDVAGSLAASRDHVCRTGSVSVDVPAHFRATPAETQRPGWFVLGGVVDSVELRAGRIVEFVALPATTERSDGDPPSLEAPALLQARPELRHVFAVDRAELPESFAVAAGSKATAWSAWELREGAEATTLLVERELPDGRGHVLLLASPPAVLAAQPDLYAAILRDAVVGGAAVDRTTCDE
ncbi:MAG: rhomboid family intramembrane serine protease [Myxococcales bacterium FL481]|nr:MAG: rhomboid family intramembrane serine protease [Myxococcales bacterium FL481]